MKTYEEIIARYGRPLDVALALKIVTPKSSYIKKQRASSRICMWAKQGCPEKWLKKLNKLDNPEQYVMSKQSVVDYLVAQCGDVVAVANKLAYSHRNNVYNWPDPIPDLTMQSIIRRMKVSNIKVPQDWE